MVDGPARFQNQAAVTASSRTNGSETRAGVTTVGGVEIAPGEPVGTMPGMLRHETKAVPKPRGGAGRNAVESGAAVPAGCAPWRSRRAPRWPRRAAVLLLPLCMAAGAQELRDVSTFQAWRVMHEAAVSEFEQHLAAHQLAGVLEPHELLKSASDWRRCDAEPYAVPPPQQWPSVLSVLRLLGELRNQGILGALTVHSAYRGPLLNDCAGGARGSAHLRTFALDFTPLDGEDPTAPLCRFWREHGRDWQMGFSRYPSGRLHIDTAGYRSWGADHTGRSAVCGAG